MRHPELSNPCRQKVEWWVDAGAGREDEEFLFNGDRVSVWDYGKALGMDGGAAAQRERTWCHSTVHLKIVKRVHFMLYVFYQNFLKV